MMAMDQESLRAFVKRKLSAAKANKGWTWRDVSLLYEALGARQTPTTLTTKHSRGSFRAQDFLLMLRGMGVRSLDLSELDVNGLDDAVRRIETGKHNRTKAK
jgi:nicotinamidase-related amidase